MKMDEAREEEIADNLSSGTEESKEKQQTKTKADMDDKQIDNIVITGQDEVLESINESLAKQICKELDGTTVETGKEGFRFSKTLKISFGVIGVFIFAIVFLFLTPLGKNFLWRSATEYAYGKMNYDEGLNVVLQPEVDDVEVTGVAPTITPIPVVWNEEHTQDGVRREEGVINILLLGEEAIDSGTARGRTDIMMIGTMNTKDNTFKLTSLMRDMLVQIPGYKDNKLNTAYEIGGIPLLYETVELNFDIKLDGYVLVGFDDFEDIIDKLGGVTIDLTSGEAHYLNSTNYISKPEYRNVVGGRQVLNGNQALGYCRIRYVKTSDNQLNDFGRTSRQRVVLNAIFDKYKSKSLPELAFLLNDILPFITTDVRKGDFEQYLKTAVNIGISEIQNLRLPADHTFEEGYVRGMSVLIPDIPKNIEELHGFIFGSGKQ
ncbi:hypothetical protein acsn021_27720 [Anaerocolumna cellulosilytica]|uniref:Uncharacterized protein n=1 Tax=Anaerocolumna cellulosilytica TaxID=433286 RepID=A0A6S6QVC6_9FIRM|nr:LCP family protein [Anaerocolumna cellulosilytica]MBB5196989.1 LCP family protein required for cell wall assembly [Anaerocolumna cellulosilytica]BCJ95203.1 hypothetical protein acsn021_27720 [Anaerocolumna cellulosilytica]